MHVPRSFVAEHDGRPVGLAQMTPRPEPHQWDVVYLALEDGPAAVGHGRPLRLVPDRRATRLLGELCDASVLLGAERLFARVPEDGEQFEMFRQVGFTPVVREYTYYRALDQPAPPRPGMTADIPGLRPQRRADAFGLLQLYQECNPKMVQMAEGMRSASWELPAGGLGRRLTRRARTQRWVVERETHKAAWVELSTQRGRIHALRIMVDERYADLVGPLVDFALGAAAAHPAQGVTVRVREHQRRLLDALDAHGFEPVDGSYLMVKLLATPVLQPQFGRVLEKVV
jgi:hypothetical protein